MGKFFSCAVMMLLLVAMFAACGQPGNSGESHKKSEAGETNRESVAVKNGDLPPLKETATVLIAEDGSASGAGFYIAKEKGYFQDYNIRVEFVKFANSDDMLPALAAGEVDIAGGISSASFFNAIARGIDVKMIADKGHNIEGQSYFSFVIRRELQDTFNSYADFRGKRIAVSTKNAVDEYIFAKMLEYAGLQRDDVQFVLMPNFGNMIASMSSGQIDAALQIEPLITKGEARGVHVRFGDTTDYAPHAQIAMVLASPQFIGQKQDIALRFMVAYLKGVRDYNDAFLKNGENKEEIIRIMTEYTALKDPEIWENVGVVGLNPNGTMFVENIRDQYEWYRSRGAIHGEVDFEKAIATEITEKAVDILGKYEY